MARLAEVTTYKNTILSNLIQNEDIVKALYSKEPNFLDSSTPVDAKSLLFTNIFPYAYIPNSQETQEAYITVLFKFRRYNNAIKVGRVCFYVFAHKDLLKTDYPWLRTDYIINKIEEMFNRSRDLGIGKLEFREMEDVKVSDYHSGSYIIYEDMSFN